jgi:mono/diheme cytochrome c family protein
VKKQRITLATGVLFGVLATATVAAADGQGMFLAKCGSCHKSGGKAAVVNPADKAGQVWAKYFERGRHPVDMGISEADLKEILGFIAAHAADSDQPATAVIPK